MNINVTNGFSPFSKICLVESRATLLSKDLKRHLFHLFASWNGTSAKPFGVIHHASNVGNTLHCGTAGNICLEEEKLQFGALQVRYPTLIYVIFHIGKWMSIFVADNTS